jgi:hypothetical protein
MANLPARSALIASGLLIGKDRSDALESGSSGLFVCCRNGDESLALAIGDVGGILSTRSLRVFTISGSGCLSCLGPSPTPRNRPSYHPPHPPTGQSYRFESGPPQPSGQNCHHLSSQYFLPLLWVVCGSLQAKRQSIGLR